MQPIHSTPAVSQSLDLAILADAAGLTTPAESRELWASDVARKRQVATGIAARLLVTKDSASVAEFLRANAALLPTGGNLSRGRRDNSTAIRVAFLTPSLAIGGAERWMLALCRYWDVRRVRAEVIIVTDPAAIDRNNVRELPRDVEIATGWDSLATVGRSVDCVIAWGLPMLAEKWPWLKRDDSLGETPGGSAPRLIEVQHGSTPAEFCRAAASAAVELRADLAAVNESCLGNYPPAVRQRVRIIANGVDPSRVAPRVGRDMWRSQHGIAADDRLLLYLGRIAPGKGVERIIDAMRHLRVAWRLAIVGPCQLDRAALQRRIAAAGAVGRAAIYPPVAHPGDWLAAADVLCLPSESEGHSLAVNEAWLASVPVVEGDHPSARSFAERWDGAAQQAGAMSVRVAAGVGSVAKSRAGAEADANDLAAAIERAAGPDGKRNAELARWVAWENYTAAAMAERWERWTGEIFSKKHAT